LAAAAEDEADGVRPSADGTKCRVAAVVAAEKARERIAAGNIIAAF